MLSPSLLSTCLLTFLTLIPLTTANPAPKPNGIAIPGPAVNLHSLRRREDAFHRGWALSESNTCTGDTFRCGKAQCCPNDAYCYTSSDTLSNICCPTGSDCAYHIALDSRCANTDWVLWTTRHDPICCLPGQLGVQPDPDSYYGNCVAAGANVAKASLATKVGQGPTVTAPLPSTFEATAAAPTLPLRR